VTGTKLARISTTAASLFVTLVISATFYQNTDGAQITMSTVERKVFAGFVSSVIVFIPFALIGFLMRRVAHQAVMRIGKMDTFELVEKSGPASQSPSEKAAAIYDDQIPDHKLFSPLGWTDFNVPAWAEYILYALLLAGALVSSIIAIFYGVQFDDDKAANWIQSFFIGWAVSALFLQTIQALLGSIFTSIVGAVSTLATGLALLITSSIVGN